MPKEQGLPADSPSRPLDIAIAVSPRPGNWVDTKMTYRCRMGILAQPWPPDLDPARVPFRQRTITTLQRMRARRGRRRLKAQAAGTHPLHAPAHPPGPPLEDCADQRVFEEVLESDGFAQRRLLTSWLA